MTDQDRPKGWWRDRPVYLRGYLPATHYYEAGSYKSICGRASRFNFRRMESPIIAVWCGSCDRIVKRASERRDALLEAEAERLAESR